MGTRRSARKGPLIYAILSIALLPSIGCGRSAPNPAKVLACMRDQRTSDDYILETKCEPLERSDKFNGTWVVGFEQSSYLDHVKEGFPLQTGRENTYELVVPKDLRIRVQSSSDGPVRAFSVSFVGRKSRLARVGNRKTLVLDRVISIHELSETGRQKASTSSS